MEAPLGIMKPQDLYSILGVLEGLIRVFWDYKWYGGVS